MRKPGGVLAFSLLCIVWAGLACADTAEDAWLELVGEKDRNLVIWDDASAKEWDVAYPVGNGW